MLLQAGKMGLKRDPAPTQLHIRYMCMLCSVRGRSAALYACASMGNANFSKKATFSGAAHHNSTVSGAVTYFLHSLHCVLMPRKGSGVLRGVCCKLAWRVTLPGLVGIPTRKHEFVNARQQRSHQRHQLNDAGIWQERALSRHGAQSKPVRRVLVSFCQFCVSFNRCQAGLRDLATSLCKFIA